MESLPVELYEAIFDHLHLIDLARLKRVCKRLRSIVQDYRIRELVISSSDLALDIFTNANSSEYQNSCIIRPGNLKRKMPYRIHTRSSKNSLFDPQHFNDSSLGPTVEFSAYNIFLRSAQFNVQFLKSLTCTCSDSPRYFGLADVNKLLLLERLEINFYYFKPFDPDHCKLSLPNLKTFLLDTCEHYVFTMQVDAPKCEGFHLRSGFGGEDHYLRVHFREPHSVKYLSLHAYHESSHVFKNIEFLQMVWGAHWIDERFFAAFPRLKTLKITEHRSLEELKQLVRLCRQGERNVKLVFHGIHLVDGKELDAFEGSDFKGSFIYGANYTSLYGLIANYDKLEDDLNFATAIEFSERANRLLEADTGRFLRKFHNLSRISSKIKIERPKLFFRLLTSCNLQFLHIKNSGMPQEYFDQLENIKTLIALHIEEETKIDLSFAFKLPILQALTTNHHVDLRKEIQLDKLGGLSLYVEKDESRLEFLKYRWGSLYKGTRYPYELVRGKRAYDKSRPVLESRKREPQNSFQDLVRRYEEIRSEMEGRRKRRNERRREFKRY